MGVLTTTLFAAAAAVAPAASTMAQIPDTPRLAIVAQDATALRAAPRDSAPQQAQLWQGDTLEIRGERLDHLQVYDHRRERAGYVRASQVRRIEPDEAHAPELLTVLRFVRDTPGAEAQGVAYAAAYLKAVPAAQLTAEPFDALGVMAERLARRASTRSGAAGNDAKLSAHVEGVAQYGVKLQSFERDGAVQLCYDGEAWRRVLMQARATPEQQARAVLGLTRQDCIDPNLRPTEREALDRAQADLLERLPAATLAALPPTLKNRLHLRRAGVWATVAFHQARHGEPAQVAGQRAVQALATVNKADLTDEDQGDYTDAAIRVGASRWAAEVPVPAKPLPANRPALLTVAGQPGETCVLLTDATHDAKAPLLRRCTWGVVWPASVSANAAGYAYSVAVQPLAAWRELWVLRKATEGWTLEVLPPATGNPLGADLGYAEFAGWTPDAEPRALVVREARTEGKVTRRFEVTRLDTLAVEKQAGSPQVLGAFQRWQDAGWKRGTVSLR